MKRPDPFYLSPAWRSLRAAIVRRDGARCTNCRRDVSGKGKARVDHKLPRSTHPHLALDPGNLRTLCADCDNQMKEAAAGSASRRSGGNAAIRGSDADGWPLDPTRRGGR